jgi:hypothetical protein
VTTITVKNYNIKRLWVITIINQTEEAVVLWLIMQNIRLRRL